MFLTSPTHVAITNKPISTNNPVPIVIDTTSAINRNGRPFHTSTYLVITSSNHPPNQPEAIPAHKPIVIPIAAAANATVIDTLVPCTRRE